MNKYQQSKIYKLTSTHTDQIYVGSTCYKYLCNRLSLHKHQYINRPNKNNTSSLKLFKLGDVKIELIELYPCDSWKELNQREQYWLETLPNCINIRKAYTSDEYKKDYRSDETRKAFIKDYANEKLKCDLCNRRFTRCNDSKHKKTLLHINAELKLEGKNTISSIQCDICKGKFWEKSKSIHDQSKKHLRALKPIDE